MPNKWAVLVGCNYPGSKYPLRGCINDVNGMKDMLKTCFGFDESNMTILIDTDQAYTQPTGANIKAKLAEMVAKVQDGDIFVFHFSGHGTQVPSSHEADGKDEALCGCDMNVITDDDLKVIFAKLPPNVKFTMIADCCHSGTLLDQDNIVISGPKPGDPPPPAIDIGQLMGLFGLREGGQASREVRNRSMPANAIFDHLSRVLGKPIDQTTFHRGMTEVFGRDAPVKAMAIAQRLMEPGAVKKLLDDPLKGAMGLLSLAAQPAQPAQSSGGGGLLGGLLGAVAGAVAGGGHNSSSNGGGYSGGPNLQTSGGGSAAAGVKLAEDTGVLITGCQPHETSADACPEGDPNRAFGALSNTLQTVVKAHYSANPNQPLSYRQLVTSVREIMGKAKFTQNPCLECSHKNAETTFIV